MKKTIICAMLVMGAFMLSAQTKPAELYDIINLLAPDSASATSVGDWKTGSISTGLIKWENATPRKTAIEYIKNGSAKMSFAGTKAQHCEISVSGKTLSGFTEVQLSTNAPMINDEPSYILEKLLGKKNYKAKLIKTEEGAFPTYNYELKMPGRKTVWIIMFAENMGGRESESLSLETVILFDRKEFDRRAQH